MASLIFRKGQKYWYCFFRLVEPSGKIVQRQLCTRVPVADSEGKTNSPAATKLRHEAQARANEIEKAHRDACGTGDESAARILAILRDAASLALKGRLSETQARQMLMAIYEAGSGESLTSWTVATWREEWLARKSGTVGKAAMELYGIATRSLLKFLGDRAQTSLEQINSTEIRKWRDSVKPGRTARTANLYHKSIKGFFAQAQAEGIILRNPADGIEFLPETDSTEKLPFELEQVQALRAAASPEWALIIAIGFYTGMRLTDITNLKWESVDLASGVFKFAPRKQRRAAKPKTLIIPIPGPLVELLLKHHVSEGSLFPSLAGKQSGGTKGLSNQFKAIMEKAGIDSKSGKLTFHSLRHTCTSIMANAGVSAEIRAKITGHSNLKTHEGYTHLEAETLKAAVAMLPEL